MSLSSEKLTATRGSWWRHAPPLHLGSMSILILLVLVNPEVSRARAHSAAEIHHHQHGEGCGVRHPTTFEKNLDHLRMNALFLGKKDNDQENRKLLSPSCTELCKQCIEVPVYFHLSGFPLSSRNESSEWVIPHPTDEFILLREELSNASNAKGPFPVVAPGRFSSIEHVYQLIQDNMDVLNRRYADTPFLFQWVNSDPAEAQVAVKNNHVFIFAGDLYQSNDFATATHVGDVRTLNVYLIHRICGHAFIWVESNCNTIGAATNPSYQLDGTADGVYLSYDTLTGGG